MQQQLKPKVCMYGQWFFGTTRCRLDKSICTLCKNGVCDIYQSSPLLEAIQNGEIISD